ncbi:hypothetical protein HKD37_01G000132 [Glycine soja]
MEGVSVSVSVSAYSLFTVSVLRRKIASGAPGGGAVGYSWSWGPLLRHRVAVKCQLEIAVFLMSVVGSVRSITGIFSPLPLGAWEVRATLVHRGGIGYTCHCLGGMEWRKHKHRKYCRVQKCRCCVWGVSRNIDETASWHE